MGYHSGSVVFDQLVAEVWQAGGLTHILRPGPLAMSRRLPGELPPVFQKALSQAKRPARYVLTYHELGLDLGGRPEAARSELWRSLFRECPHLSGKTAFIPCSRLDGEQLTGDPEAFFDSLRLLRPQSVLCFGRTAWDTLFPRLEAASRLVYHQNLRLVALPDPQRLLPIGETDFLACAARLRGLDPLAGATEQSMASTTSNPGITS